MKKRILFSCAGTTDPARGDHDGGLLHILRHYRPEAVCIFLSPEMTDFEQSDGRFSKMLTHVKENWDGYAPEVTMIHADLADASDLDELDEPMRQAMADFMAIHGDAQLLINLSSGTPQMKTILSQMALDIRYDSVGIQVKNPEKKAGTTKRSNSKEYIVEEELEYAEMTETAADAENRCSEPKLFAMRREMQWQQVEALLEQRNYTAVSAMTDSLSAPSMQLVKHLAARNALQSGEAKRLARGLNLPFSLYPTKCSAGEDYKEVSEYYLMLKNLHHNHRLTDFTIRLNPFIVRLLEAELNVLLKKHYGVTIPDLMEWSDRVHREQITIVQMVNKALPLYRALNDRLAELNKDSFRDSDPSIFIYNRMLESFHDAPDGLKALFNACETLNLRQRNTAAHTLYGMTEDNLRSALGMDSSTLIRRLEQAMLEIYPECDPTLFNLHRKCVEYIKQNR